MKIRYKITLAVGVAVFAGLAASTTLFMRHQEHAVLDQNERTMLKVTESVSQGLQAVMLAGYADIAESFADRLKGVPEVLDFRIMRLNGDEAFRDNQTITDVNRRRGEEVFFPREQETRVPILAADDPVLRRAIETLKPIATYSTGDDGVRVMTFVAPIMAIDACAKCHGRAGSLRGAIKLTTSLATVEQELAEMRRTSVGVLAIALLITTALTAYMLGRTVIRPLEKVTAAMVRVSGGDLSHKVPIASKDELGRMANSFNLMTAELKNTYDGLRREQDKLTTIIFSAGEGIVVTDGEGTIVLVNPAAERLLDKPAQQILDAGFEQLFDDPQAMEALLAGGKSGGPLALDYKSRVLNVYASTISGENGNPVGSAALLRDITEEKRLENELRRLSTTDGLTGLFNRRHLDQTLATEFGRAARTGAALSVLMFDIDHFKKFNDTHGHDQGDRVLRDVAHALRGALRQYDVPCRYGGEEFVAILPNTTGDGAWSVAERLRTDIEAMRTDGLQVTVSIGIACTPEIVADRAEALIEAADAALYRSKGGGRNRTTRAT